MIHYEQKSRDWWILTALVWDGFSFYETQQYLGYEKREATALFKQHLKDNNLAFSK